MSTLTESPKTLKSERENFRLGAESYSSLGRVERREENTVSTFGRFRLRTSFESSPVSFKYLNTKIFTKLLALQAFFSVILALLWVKNQEKRSRRKRRTSVVDPQKVMHISELLSQEFRNSALTWRKNLKVKLKIVRT